MVVLVRVLLLAIGMGAFEVGLGGAIVEGSIGGWLLLLGVAIPATVAGSAGFMVPLLESSMREARNG